MIERGRTESVKVPVGDLIREKRFELQTNVIVSLIKEANLLGLNGKRVTELVSEPTFMVHDLLFYLKWVREE